jgi:hypothetical protein
MEQDPLNGSTPGHRTSSATSTTAETRGSGPGDSPEWPAHWSASGLSYAARGFR